jgi:tRNA threonylcarbamoyladenosine biosynthesis protein TsaB
MGRPVIGGGVTGPSPLVGAVIGGGATLGVTSSTGVMSLAVGHTGPQGVTVLGSVEVATERRHAEELGPRLRDLIDAAPFGFGDLECLVVDIGPGRFTGLRVGLATVRALAFALDRPVVGLTSLEILAAGAARPGAGATGPEVEVGPVTAVVDARRREVFQQVFVDGSPVGPPQVGRPEDLVAEARGVVVGDGVDRYREIYGEAARVRAGLVPVDGRHPRAADMLRLATGRRPGPGTAVEPLYLRGPDAKANIRTRPEGAVAP